MRLTSRLEGSGGTLSADPDDFEVDEILPYAAEGEGEHLFVRIEKRGLDTMFAARRLAQAFGLAPPGRPTPLEVGIAGLKDRHAVARQWISLPWPSDRPLPSLGTLHDHEPELVVLEAKRHRHKLRRGHVAANRFVIRIRAVPDGGAARARAILERLRVTGVPNPFGPQRFGVDGDNAKRAREWLAGRGRRPRDGRLHRLLLSSLQSEIFNRVLRRRIEAGLLTVALGGDRMVKHASGGQFLVDDPDADQPRVDSLEISPTGPLFGKKTPRTEGLAHQMEAEALAEAGVESTAIRGLGPGGRRPLRYPLDPEATIEALGTDAYELRVTLPSGAYATALLDELVQPEDGPFTRATPKPR